MDAVSGVSQQTQHQNRADDSTDEGGKTRSGHLHLHGKDEKGVSADIQDIHGDADIQRNSTVPH